KFNAKTAYKIESSIFLNDISNMITLAHANETEYTYRNIGNFKSKGIQINIEFTIYQYKFDFGASYIGSYNELAEKYINYTYNYYPEVRVNAHYDFIKINLTAAIFYKYSGELPSYIIGQNDNLIQTITEDFHT